MKWRAVPKPPFDYTQPHSHFVWKPIQIGDYYYWMCFVLRQAIVEEGQVPPTKDTLKEYKWAYEEPSYCYY